jgi:hypothetical protein
VASRFTATIRSESRSGLSKDLNIARITPTLIIQQFDATHFYDREYEIETKLSNGRWLYRYARTKKQKL